MGEKHVKEEGAICLKCPIWLNMNRECAGEAQLGRKENLAVMWKYLDQFSGPRTRPALLHGRASNAKVVRFKDGSTFLRIGSMYHRIKETALEKARYIAAPQTGGPRGFYELIGKVDRKAILLGHRARAEAYRREL